MVLLACFCHADVLHSAINSTDLISRWPILRRLLLFAVLVASSSGFAAEPVSTLPSAAAPSVSGNSDSFASVISADGNFVLFTSQAGNLVTNDRNGPFLDVFLRNMTNDQTVLVSVTPDGLSSGNGSSTAVGISTNNRYVLFESRASNLVPNDTNNASDIFLRDIVNQTTALVSVNRFGAASGKGGSSNPVMTPDGRYVAFESVAADLVDHDTNGVADVFVR